MSLIVDIDCVSVPGVPWLPLLATASHVTANQHHEPNHRVGHRHRDERKHVDIVIAQP